MDINRNVMDNSLLEWNKRNFQPNRESAEYKNTYANNFPSTSRLSVFLKPSQDSSHVQSQIVKDLQLKVHSLTVMCDIFGDMIRKFNVDLAQIKADRDAMATEISTLRVRSMFNINHWSSTDRQARDDNNNAASEILERYQRSKNLLVYNIHDSMEETPKMLNALITDLLAALRFNHEFPEVKRIGNYRRQARPILLVFKSPVHVKMIMKHKTQLRFSKYWKNILITEDRMINQRHQMKSQQPQAPENEISNQVYV